ncbi:MAG: NAD-binding protein [Oscillospiraceae bacterium]
MKITIVGGGNVGYYLVKTLAGEKHRIMLIENDRERCEQIAESFGGPRVEITNGDATDVNCLRDSKIEESDVLIAVTGRDQNNLVACQLAKGYFGVKKTISRVNNPKNIRVFERLGVDAVISSTARIAAIIEQELEWPDVNRIMAKKGTQMRMNMVTVEKGSYADGKHVSELGLPKGAILVSVIRENDAIVPNGATVINAFDEIIVLAGVESTSDVTAKFINIA